MDFKEFQEILTKVLNTNYTSHQNQWERLDKITQKSIDILQCNFKFFKDIPLQNLELELLILCSTLRAYEYENSFKYKSQRWFLNMNKSNINKDIDNSKHRPITAINKDIKALKKYSSLIKEMFSYDKDKCDFFLNRNELLLKDLEEKKFNIIDKYHYYDCPTSKTLIKKTLENIREKYKLKNVSLEEKQIIDELPTYQPLKSLEPKLLEYSKITFREWKENRDFYIRYFNL